MTDGHLKKTVLNRKHHELNAKMAPFADFEMPIQYNSVKDEVLAVRENVGVFDVSHMGEFFVEGPQAHQFVDFIVTNDFINAGEYKAVYSPLCREDGTVIDDLIAYKLGDEKVLICVNASNIEKDWSWISSQVKNFDCKLSNHSDAYSLLAIQGPKSQEVLNKIGVKVPASMAYYSVSESLYLNSKIILARTGYTGEDGFELFCSNDIVEKIWDELLALNVTACGLAARDVLRLEVCYPLYGHELSDKLTPLDSALKWTVKLNKEKFIGKKALENYKAKYKLIKIVLDKGIPRQGHTVLSQSGEQIGEITSGTMSVVLNKGIGLALVQAEKYNKEKTLLVNIRNKNYEASVASKAFVNGGHL